MPQPVAERAVDVGPLVQRVHLVHAHVAQPLVLALEHVEQPDRLPVGQREDHVRARADVREDVLRPAGGGQRSRHQRVSITTPVALITASARAPGSRPSSSAASRDIRETTR